MDSRLHDWSEKILSSMRQDGLLRSRIFQKIFFTSSLVMFGLLLYFSNVTDIHRATTSRLIHETEIYPTRETYGDQFKDNTNVKSRSNDLSDISRNHGPNTSSGFYSIDSFPPELVKLRPKIFNDVPSQFLPEYKNPCYYGRDKSFHCLPYFFLLGNPKSGTTDIWGKLLAHPEIIEKEKEMHWWTRLSRSEAKQVIHPYEDVYFTWSVKRAPEHNMSMTAVVTGDGSASTYWDNDRWETIYPEFYNAGPPYVIADVLHAFLPNAKLIVSFRDPTTRLYSDFIYFGSRIPRSPGTFHSLVVREIKKYQDCVTSRSRRACAYDAKRMDKVRLRIGLYSVPIQDWLRVYPRTQLYTIKLEEWSTNCRGILPELYKFLEVGQLTESHIDNICSEERRRITKKKKNAGKMLSSTRKLLREFYRPFVLELASTLNDTRFLWDYQ